MNTSQDTSSSGPVGLIAGNGRLPILVARGMREAGRSVACIGLAGLYEPDLERECDVFRKVGFLRLGQWIRTLRRWGAVEAVMVGGVRKQRMHDRLRLFRQIPDARAAMLWYRRLRHDRRNQSVLSALADELMKNGISLIDSTTYIPDHLATQGVLTSVQPTTQQQADIEFGWPLLDQTARLHIGQSIAVRDRDVIAVEAIEGTDAMIARAGEVCRAKGWTLLKTSAADHDMRADVPTIGVQTIENLERAGGRCIALGAGRVILLDKPAVLAAADKAGVAIVGM